MYTHTLRGIRTLVFAALFSALGASLSASTPVVEFINPAPNDTEVALNSTFRIELNMPLDPASVSPDYFTDEDAQIQYDPYTFPSIMVLPAYICDSLPDSLWKAMALRGSFEMETGESLVFTPSGASMAPGTTYKVLVSGLSVTGEFGETLDVDDAEITFTTLTPLTRVIGHSVFDDEDGINCDDVLYVDFSTALPYLSTSSGSLVEVERLFYSASTTGEVVVSSQTVAASLSFAQSNTRIVAQPAGSLLPGEPYRLRANLSYYTGNEEDDFETTFIVKELYTLTLSARSQDGQTDLTSVCDFTPSGTGPYYLESGEMLNIETAEYCADFVFDHWHCPGVGSIHGSTSRAINFSLLCGDLQNTELRAVYEPVPEHTVTVTASAHCAVYVYDENGMLLGTSGSYDVPARPGAFITVRAEPEDGYVFTEWDSDITGISGSKVPIRDAYGLDLGGPGNLKPVEEEDTGCADAPPYTLTTEVQVWEDIEPVPPPAASIVTVTPASFGTQTPQTVQVSATVLDDCWAISKVQVITWSEKPGKVRKTITVLDEFNDPTDDNWSAPFELNDANCAVTVKVQVRRRWKTIEVEMVDEFGTAFVFPHEVDLVFDPKPSFEQHVNRIVQDDYVLIAERYRCGETVTVTATATENVGTEFKIWDDEENGQTYYQGPTPQTASNLVLLDLDHVQSADRRLRAVLTSEFKLNYIGVQVNPDNDQEITRILPSEFAVRVAQELMDENPNRLQVSPTSRLFFYFNKLVSQPSVYFIRQTNNLPGVFAGDRMTRIDCEQVTSYLPTEGNPNHEWLDGGRTLAMSLESTSGLQVQKLNQIEISLDELIVDTDQNNLFNPGKFNIATELPTITWRLLEIEQETNVENTTGHYELEAYTFHYALTGRKSEFGGSWNELDKYRQNLPYFDDYYQYHCTGTLNEFHPAGSPSPEFEILSFTPDSPREVIAFTLGAFDWDGANAVDHVDDILNRIEFLILNTAEPMDELIQEETMRNAWALFNTVDWWKLWYDADDEIGIVSVMVDAKDLYGFNCHRQLLLRDGNQFLGYGVTYIRCREHVEYFKNLEVTIDVQLD